MADLQLTITTPEKLVFDGTARFVVVPAADGELGILPRHAPLVGTLGYGGLRVQSASDGGTSGYFVRGGFLEVIDDRVTVLATEAVPVSELDAEQDRVRLGELESARPSAGASFDEWEAYRESLAAAKARLKLGRQAS